MNSEIDIDGNAKHKNERLTRYTEYKSNMGKIEET
jgi:hypothetical protein